MNRKYDIILFRQCGKLAGYWRQLPYLKSLDETTAVRIHASLTRRGWIVKHIPSKGAKQ